jgi:hypothetical protein
MKTDGSSTRRSRHALGGAALAIAALAIALIVSSGWRQRVAAPTQTPPPVAAAPATVAPEAKAPAASPATSIGWVDAPSAELITGSKVHVSGWALDPAGIASVEVRLDGRAYPARYGLKREDVSRIKPGYPDSAAPGFEFDGDFGSITPERHALEIVARSRAGAETVIARKSLIPPDALRVWSDLLAARPGLAKPPFRFLMMTSGVTQGGATDADTAYRSYLSRTQQTGIAVPILYMRTTRGAANDWLFDPNFDLTHKCEKRQVAEDSLNGVIRYVVQKKLPVQFILNGGLWSNASCGAPEWDLNDRMEEDINNCQWSQDNVVFPPDYSKNLIGSTESPRLARALTYNVYATMVRDYKRRNLQAAARIIARFAREHPELFVGINLDSDTYMNPFFINKEWFDYNPGMLKQFRHWLAGSGPYEGEPEPGVPDLRTYRRKHPLTLAEVNRIARKDWHSWNEVDPPRSFPGSPRDPLVSGQPIIWDDPWYQEWETFRKHVVGLHYDELSEWTHEAGIPKDRIFSAQGFLAPDKDQKAFAVYLSSRGQNYDSAGVSIEGAKPRAGHIGAVIYGDAAENNSKMEFPHSLFATFARLDPGWAVVETNATNLKTPKIQPTYAQSYHAFRDMFNYDARQISLMAWNGSNGAMASDPAYQPWTAWRNTPAENAMRAFLVSHADLPLGARLWTFGDPSHGDDDGWRAEGGKLDAPGGFLDVELGVATLALISPPDQVIRTAKIDSLVLGLHDPGALERVQVFARVDPDAPWQAITPSVAAKTLSKVNAGLRVPLQWPAAWRAESVIATQLKLELRFHEGTRRVRVDRVALYPAARSLSAQPSNQIKAAELERP